MCSLIRTGAPPVLGSSRLARASATDDQWRRLLEADRDAMPSQAPEWVDIVCARGRYRDASRLYEMPDGRRAVLPMVRRAGPVGSVTGMESMPDGWGYGGLIAPDGVTVDLAGAVMRDLTETTAVRAILRPNPLHASVWARAALDQRAVTAVPRRAHVLDLAGGFDEVWRSRFRPGTRTKVRRAERLGVTVQTDTSGELVEVFYELLTRSFDRWAVQQHEPRWLTHFRGRRRDPIEKFRLMAARLGGRCRISVAWYGGRPAAAIIVLRNEHNAHYTRGAMDKTLAGQVYANYLLHRDAIQDACESGCLTYHMGESRASSGLSEFKEHFGARAHPYAEYLIEHVPISRIDGVARNSVKRAIGFRDV